ncbi:phage/plasmid primase, P4 family [Mycobacteroides abscessus]|uniref:DNA primase family protein n=1 Tax=Mycobacteroides abscessus TaxID=36809 RepID=UPI00078E9F22|nr:phage/plasmid primase, P4 family [Mycobacteroides abscessus]AMU74386.1 hypothetical protein A3O06_06725 [Mycobacteroides abscessus]ANO23322.1 hypothetical protein BAB79_06720 [Mycobacteroides abscessus]
MVADPTAGGLTGATDSDDVDIEEQYTKGQVRMAHALHRMFARRLIHVPGVGWYYWDGVRWRLDELERSTRFVLRTFKRALTTAEKRAEQAKALESSDPAKSERLKRYADKLVGDVYTCQSAAGIRGVKEIARSANQFACLPIELDKDPYLINVQNGTLNLKTGKFHQPHDPDHLITKVCNASFDPDAFDPEMLGSAAFDPTKYCPNWLQFLHSILPDQDVRDFLQVLVGLALVGTQLEHVLVIFFGNGRNGKGVFERVVCHVFGDYAVTAARDLFTSSPGAHSTSQTDLMGSRLAIVNETEQGARLSEALVKDATGGGIHTARRMKQDNIRFHRSWLAVMVTNHFPHVTGQGAAIWDRLMVIDFPRHFALDDPNRVPDIDEQLKKEADGIFMWAYAGLLRYWRDGSKLIVPDAVKAATQEHRHRNDTVERWIDECCERGTGAAFQTKAKVLLDDYNQWASTAEMHGSAIRPRAKQMGIQEFLQTLRDKDFKHLKNRASVAGLRPKADTGNVF